MAPIALSSASQPTPVSPQAISKVASGGELSRIALAIQVITARKMETPALIFDEVDVESAANRGGRR
jgi:DNA repair ATPase RecN